MGLLQYQFLQENINSITVKVILTGQQNDEVIQTISTITQEALGEDMSIHVRSM